jgi:hypothetical protein
LLFAFGLWPLGTFVVSVQSRGAHIGETGAIRKQHASLAIPPRSPRCSTAKRPSRHQAKTGRITEHGDVRRGRRLPPLTFARFAHPAILSAPCFDARCVVSSTLHCAYPPTPPRLAAAAGPLSVAPHPLQPPPCCLPAPPPPPRILHLTQSASLASTALPARRDCLHRASEPP